MINGWHEYSSRSEVSVTIVKQAFFVEHVLNHGEGNVAGKEGLLAFLIVFFPEHVKLDVGEATNMNVLDLRLCVQEVFHILYKQSCLTNLRPTYIFDLWPFTVVELSVGPSLHSGDIGGEHTTSDEFNSLHIR